MMRILLVATLDVQCRAQPTKNAVLVLLVASDAAVTCDVPGDKQMSQTKAVSCTDDHFGMTTVDPICSKLCLLQLSSFEACVRSHQDSLIMQMTSSLLHRAQHGGIDFLNYNPH